MLKSQRNSEKFSLTLRFFHWTGVPLMVAVYASIWMRKLFEKGSAERKLMVSVHFGLGVLVLAWLLFRLVAYFAGKKPPIVPPVPSWQKSALKLMQGLQWGLMAVLPLSGWLLVNAKGRVVEIGALGLEMKLPTLLQENKVLAKALNEGHEAMGVALLVLIALHTGMALWHHVVKRDNALRRML